MVSTKQVKGIITKKKSYKEIYTSNCKNHIKRIYEINKNGKTQIDLLD